MRNLSRRLVDSDILLLIGLMLPLQANAKPLMYEYFSNLTSSSDLSRGEKDGFLINTAYVTNLANRGMQAEAESVGVLAGQYYAEERIGHILEATGEQLDEIIDISPYLMTHKSYLIMPPIMTVSEGNKKYLNNEKTAFTYADITYVIQSDPYFIDAPPSWRDYVVMNAKPPKIMSDKLLPSTSEEKEQWKQGFDRGWKIGIDTAIQNTIYQLTRAVYDLQGVQLYTMLKDANLVSEPIIRQADYNTTGDSKQLDLGSGMVSIEVLPVVNHNVQDWKLIPALPPLDELLPREMYELLLRVGNKNE